MCRDCKQQVENIEHLLLKCPHAAAIWTKMQEFFQEKEQIAVPIPINQSTVIFGQCSKDIVIRKWNYIALLVKFYIHRSRLNSNNLNWNGCKAFIMNRLEILIFNATLAKNDKEKSKWQNWINQ